MKKPNKCVLDGDILAFKAACWADIEGVDYLEDRLKEDIRLWTPEGCDEVIVAFSCNRADNYRRDYWKSYKAHRDARDKPDCLIHSVDILTEGLNIEQYDRIEADDIMGIAASSGDAIAVTIDKDLKGVPGWHYNPDKDECPNYIDDAEADKFLAFQLIKGDSTDGIPGLPGKGKRFFESEIIKFDQEDWLQEIYWAYQEDGFDKEYFLAQARCVRILREGEFNKETQDINAWFPEEIYSWV